MAGDILQGVECGIGLLGKSYVFLLVEVHEIAEEFPLMPAGVDIVIDQCHTVGGEVLAAKLQQ